MCDVHIESCAFELLANVAHLHPDNIAQLEFSFCPEPLGIFSSFTSCVCCRQLNIQIETLHANNCIFSSEQYCKTFYNAKKVQIGLKTGVSGVINGTFVLFSICHPDALKLSKRDVL